MKILLDLGDVDNPMQYRQWNGMWQQTGVIRHLRPNDRAVTTVRGNGRMTVYCTVIIKDRKRPWKPRKPKQIVN